MFDIKERALSKSLITLVDSDGMLQRYVKEVPEICWDLIDVTETPLSIIYPEAKGLAENVPAEDGSIAIRMTKDEFCKSLVHRFGKPIVSTSANISGEPTPSSFVEISPKLQSRVDYIVNLRRNEKAAAPSSILKVGLNGEISIIRK